MNQNCKSDLHHLRDHIEAKRRARILTFAVVAFTSVSCLGLLFFGAGGEFERAPAALRYADQTGAAKELALLLNRLNETGSTTANALRDVREISEILDQYPLLKNRSEAGLIRAVTAHEDPEYRAEILLQLSRIRSARALSMIQAEFSRIADQPALVKALERYLGGKGDPSARDLLWRLAKDPARSERAEAARVLARHMDRRIASIVPELLRPESKPGDVIAGLEVVGRLGLKEYRARASAYSTSNDASLREQARRTLDRLDTTETPWVPK